MAVAPRALAVAAGVRGGTTSRAGNRGRGASRGGVGSGLLLMRMKSSLRFGWRRKVMRR